MNQPVQRHLQLKRVANGSDEPRIADSIKPAITAPLLKRSQPPNLKARFTPIGVPTPRVVITPKGSADEAHSDASTVPWTGTPVASKTKSKKRKVDGETPSSAGTESAKKSKKRKQDTEEPKVTKTPAKVTHIPPPMPAGAKSTPIQPPPVPTVQNSQPSTMGKMTPVPPPKLKHQPSSSDVKASPKLKEESASKKKKSSKKDKVIPSTPVPRKETPVPVPRIGGK